MSRRRVVASRMERRENSREQDVEPEGVCVWGALKMTQKHPVYPLACKTRPQLNSENRRERPWREVQVEDHAV